MNDEFCSNSFNLNRSMCLLRVFPYRNSKTACPTVYQMGKGNSLIEEPFNDCHRCTYPDRLGRNGFKLRNLDLVNSPQSWVMRQHSLASIPSRLPPTSIPSLVLNPNRAGIADHTARTFCARDIDLAAVRDTVSHRLHRWEEHHDPKVDAGSNILRDPRDYARLGGTVPGREGQVHQVRARGTCQDDALQGRERQVRQVRHTGREAHLMPRGSHHDETGWLNADDRRLLLRRDTGGSWQLDAPARAWKLVGRRVRVTGTRADFDLLEVTSIDAL